MTLDFCTLHVIWNIKAISSTWDKDKVALQHLDGHTNCSHVVHNHEQSDDSSVKNQRIRRIIFIMIFQPCNVPQK